MIWPRSAILHSARRVERRRHLRIDRLDRGQDRDLRLLHAERHREIDRVLADVDLVLERRRDVDRRVGDDEDLVVGRHVHDEHVADAPAGAQPGLLRHDRAEQLVAVQAALHQQLGLALPHQLHRLAAARMAVRRVDDPDADRARSRSPSAISRIFAAGPTRIGTISPCSAGLDRAGQRRLLAGMRDRGRHRLEARHRASSCSYFPVPVVRSHELPRATAAGSRTAGPVSFRKNVEHDGEAHAVQQRRERRLVVFERASRRRRR